MVPPLTHSAVLSIGFAAARPVTGFSASGLARDVGRAATCATATSAIARRILCILLVCC